MAFYMPDKLAALLGVSKSTVLRQHLVTEEGLAAFVAAHTGPASTQTRAVHTVRHKKPAGDPGPI